MNRTEPEQLRQDVLTAVVAKCPVPPGRTTMMKFMYILQCVCGVPLGYRFRLYNYGPYDDRVLTDLRVAVSEKRLQSRLISFANGSGAYEFLPGDAGGLTAIGPSSQAHDFESQIDWVLTHFGRESAARMELISTVIFVQNETDALMGLEEVVRRVHNIKPHFTADVIASTVAELAARLPSTVPTLEQVN